MANTRKQHDAYVQHLYEMHSSLRMPIRNRFVLAKYQKDADTKGVWIEVERRNSPQRPYSNADWRNGKVKVVITGNQKGSWLLPVRILNKLMNAKAISEASHRMSKGFHLSITELGHYAIKKI